MPPDILATLKSCFGYDHFRPGQKEAIESLLDGHHTLVVMPTGSGKSLIFQITALHLPGMTLVISPLIALMKDQVDSLNRRGIPATFINSSLPPGELNKRLVGLARGAYRLAFIAPERLRNLSFLNALASQKVSLVAIDEAHCISEWGHDFRPDYLNISKFREKLKNPLTAALTATATPQVQKDIARLLGLQGHCQIVTGFNRPNLSLEVRTITGDKNGHYRNLQELLSPLKKGAAIIYTGTRRDAEEAAYFVTNHLNIKTHFYHAGLSPEDRTAIQDSFMYRKTQVVAATNAFGMGIDRSDVRIIIHYSIPGSLEAYYQEAGRAGRDGLPARAVLLYSAKDRALQEWFIDSRNITLQDLRMVFTLLSPHIGRKVGVAVDELVTDSGLSDVKVRVALSELERGGMLEHAGDSGYQMLIKPIAWNNEQALSTIARAQLRQNLLHQKLDSMIAYAQASTCRRKIILNHFGDPGPADAENCCDNCVSPRQVGRSNPESNHVPPAYPKKPHYTTAAPASARHSTSQILTVIEDCVRHLPAQLPRSGIAKLLVGSLSIRVASFKNHSFYNKLSGHSRTEVLRLVDQLIVDGVLSEDHNGHMVIGNPGNDKNTKAGQIQAIVRAGDNRSVTSVEGLIENLKSPDGNVRRLAASALGKIRDRRAVIPLINLLKVEVKPQVRQYAVKALGEIGDPSAIPTLQVISASTSEMYYTQISAQKALKKLQRLR